MSKQEVIVIAIMLVMIYTTAKTHKRSIRRSILLAEDAVSEYLTNKGYNILNLISNQKEIKVKGLHVGMKIKAIILNKEKSKIELVLVHNSLTNNVKIVGEKIL